jgi:transcriptional regulator with XRE-family HTH domain
MHIAHSDLRNMFRIGDLVLHDDLKRARKELGLSMVDAATLLGMSQSQLSRIETGKSGLTAQRLAEIAGTYGLSASKLLDGATVRTMSDTDLDRIGQVIEFVEATLANHAPRPSPQVIRNAVITIFRHETSAVHATAKPFDPTSYREILLSMIGAHIP